VAKHLGIYPSPAYKETVKKTYVSNQEKGNVAYVDERKKKPGNYLRQGEHQKSEYIVNVKSFFLF